MRVSIGILARNEASGIGSTIRSLAEQSILVAPPTWLTQAEVVCVPNGCTDDTAEVARRACRQWLEGGSRGPLRWAVHELPTPGKAHAWNQFVHGLSDQEADVVVLIDADIRFAHAEVLRVLLEGLRVADQAVAAAGVLVKDAVFRRPRNVLERFSLAVSRHSHATVHGIAGGLYCVRGPTIRRIWMPPGLLGEDGFLRAMIVTTEFTRPDDLSRFIRVPEAIAIYEPERKIPAIFRHSRRLALGTAMNAVLYTELWARSTAETPAGEIVRRNNERDPDWARKLIAAHLRCSRGWVLPAGLPWNRVHQVRRLPWRSRPRGMLVAVASLPFDLAVCWSANRAMKRQAFAW